MTSDGESPRSHEAALRDHVDVVLVSSALLDDPACIALHRVWTAGTVHDMSSFMLSWSRTIRALRDAQPTEAWRYEIWEQSAAATTRHLMDSSPRGSAWEAAQSAVLALLARDLLIDDGVGADDYDRLSSPWRTAVGPLHPQDPNLLPREHDRSIVNR